MNILIPIEISSRELLYKLFLCHLLAAKGFNCFLGSKSQINHLITCFNDYIYLDKGYHLGESEKLYKLIQQNNGLIVSLDEEGAVDFEDHSTLLSRYSKQFFNMVDLTFLWGLSQFKIIKNNLNKDSKFVISGHPRFEMLKSKYNFFYEEETKKIKKIYGNFILINTNMGFGNNIKGDKFVKSNYRERFGAIEQIVACDKRKVELFIQLAKKLAKQTGFKIIFRPHPEENFETYENAFKNFDNIIITNTGSVIPWLYATHQMIHPDCTTAIESLFIGKQSFSILPNNLQNELITKLPIYASKTFKNIDKLILAITAKLEEPNIEKYDLLDSYFSIKNSTINIIIKELSDIRNNYQKMDSQQLLMQTKIWLKFKCLKSELLNKEAQQLINNKLKGFNSQNIEKINQLISKSENYNSDVTCKKINNQLYEFHIN